MINRFNTFGFGYDWDRAGEPRESPKHMTCDVHYATFLVTVKGELGKLQCPECGIKYEDPEYQGEAEALATEIDEMIKRNRHIVRK
jgi:hypothetical protein